MLLVRFSEQVERPGYSIIPPTPANAPGINFKAIHASPHPKGEASGTASEAENRNVDRWLGVPGPGTLVSGRSEESQPCFQGPCAFLSKKTGSAYIPPTMNDDLIWLRKELDRVEGRVLDFGCFSGWRVEHVCGVNRRYLRWYLSTVPLRPEVRKTILRVLSVTTARLCSRRGRRVESESGHGSRRS